MRIFCEGKRFQRLNISQAALALSHLVQCPVLLEACPQSSLGSRSASEDEIPFSQVVISLLPLALSPAASAIYNASLCEGLSSRNGDNLIFVSMPRLPPRLLVSGGGLSASLPASHLCSSPQEPSNRPASFTILIPITPAFDFNGLFKPRPKC